MLNKLLIVDKKTNKISYTLTAFLWGFLIVNIKFLISGIQITNTIKFAEFSGVEYGAAIAGLGSIYVLRKNNSIKQDDEKKE